MLLVTMKTGNVHGEILLQKKEYDAVIVGGGGHGLATAFLLDKKNINIEKILDKFPHQISAGEAQRASLARSLVAQPELLLLDEPLSNVDQSFKEEIQVQLKQIFKRFKNHNNKL